MKKILPFIVVTILVVGGFGAFATTDKKNYNINVVFSLFYLIHKFKNPYKLTYVNLLFWR
jgi:hypothetical protein